MNHRRITRLKNRIRRTERRLAACHTLDRNPRRAKTIRNIVLACDSNSRDFEDVVDRVADALDAKIRPSHPLWRWVTKIGIDIVAFAAVAIHRQTQHRLRNRLLRDKAALLRLTTPEPVKAPKLVKP